MALNLNKNICMNLNEPVTQEELKIAKNEYEAIQSECEESVTTKADARFRQADIKFAIKHNDTVTKTCRIRSRRKKRLDKKLYKQQQEREQSARARKACKHSKEMRNREAVQKKAKEMYKQALDSRTARDDLFALSAMGLSKRFDGVIYNTPTSDVDSLMEDMFEDVVGGDIDDM